MPIFNASVTGEGGGQGGGDKVTALVGSNASGIDVGDKVILNYPAVNETGYCSEYRFQSYTGGSRASGQWTVFFGEYMMYVDTSGHPVFFKHDTVNDKLVFIKALGVTLPTIGIIDDTGTGATRITYNETTKRFAVCKSGTLTIYQAEISDTDANVSTIYSATTIAGNGGIAQDTDTFWYMTTSGDFDSIVVKDFTYSNGTFTEGSAYTHTNTSPSFDGTYCPGVGFSPNLEKFAISVTDSSSRSYIYIGGVNVSKESKQISYCSSKVSISLNSYAPRSYVLSLNNSGNGVVTQIYSGGLRQASFNVASDASISDIVVGPLIDYSSGVGYSGSVLYFYFGCGIVHQTGDWVTGPIFALNITSSGFSKIDITAASPGTTGGVYPSDMIAALSSTGIFMWPYTVNGSGTPSIGFGNILTRWNNGAPTRGDTYIEPASELTSPFYFDGNYLYAQGGIYATDGGTGLTRIGNSTYSPGWRCPSIPMADGSMAFGYGDGTCNYIYVKDGVITGSFPNTNLNIYAVDMRLNSSRTGWAATCATTSNVSGQGIDYIENGSRKSHKSSAAAGGFLDKDGNAYMYYASINTTSPFHIYSCAYNGSGSGASGIDTTEIFTSAGLWNLLGGANQYAAAVCDRIDNIHLWYKCNNAIVGFTKFDLTNLSITPLTTPAAIGQVSGTVYAAWWDLDNRLFIRTSTGLFVFAYTNHDISTMQLVKKFEWSTDYSGPATCSSDLMSYAVGKGTYVKVVRETVMPVYEFSANVYNGHNVASTSLTGFVNEAISTDPWGQSIVEVNTVKDPADTWTNVGTPFGFDVSTTSENVSVGRGYYNSGSAEVIIPSTVTKTIAQIGTNQTLGYKNDIYVYRDTSDVCSDLMCKTGTTPVGTFKASTALSTNVYLNDDKTVIAGTSADSGFSVSYEPASDVNYAYTVEGSATVVDGVASNFGTNDYIKFSSDFGTPTSFEMGLKLKTPANWNNGMDGEYIGVNFTDKSGFYVKFMSSGSSYSSGIVEFNVSTSAGSWGSATRSSYAFLPNTVYYMKINWNGSTWKLYYSLDGESYTQLLSVNYSTWISRPENYFVLGTCGCWGRAHPFLGSIYLNDCYMKVNGLLWWSPAADPYGSVTVGEGYHYIDETDTPYYLDSDLTRTASQMVVHPEDFVTGSTEGLICTTVGSPTIDSSFNVSGLSTSDYVYKNSSQGPQGGSCSLYGKFTIPQGASGEVITVIAGDNTSTYTSAIGISISNGYAKLDAFNSSNTGSTALTSGASYWFRIDIAAPMDAMSPGSATLFIAPDNNYSSFDQVPSASWSQETWLIDSAFEIGYDPFVMMHHIMVGVFTATPWNPTANLQNPFTGTVDLRSIKGTMESSTDSAYDFVGSVPGTTKTGYLFLTQPTAGTTSSVVSANATPTATYVGSVVTPVSLGKTVTMDTTLTKILAVEDA